MGEGEGYGKSDGEIGGERGREIEGCLYEQPNLLNPEIDVFILQVSALGGYTVVYVS